MTRASGWLPLAYDRQRIDLLDQFEGRILQHHRVCRPDAAGIVDIPLACRPAVVQADETAARHEVSVDEDTNEPEKAYARWIKRQHAGYQEGWLP